MKIKYIEKVEYTGPVYNLEVSDFHNYFIEGGILVSNCHGAKAQSIQEISKKCVNAEYRLGFTGTLPEDKCEYMTIQSGLGDVLNKITSDTLIEKGILSDITIANILLRYPIEKIEECKKREYQDEVRIINECVDRNKILKWIFNNIPDKQNTLILVTQIEHLKDVKSYLERNLDKKYNIQIIYGQVKAEEREEIRKSIETTENTILVATYGTMSVGVNIKKLHNVIFYSSFKSKIRVLQSIGRGLRTHEDKDKLILFDIVDDLTWDRQLTKGVNKGKWIKEKNYVYQHFEERIRYYKEQGFPYFSKKVEMSNLT